MPTAADWRGGAGYEPDDTMDWPRIAMGYLARNDRYREDHAEAAAAVQAGERSCAEATDLLVERWGISLPVDADLSGGLQQVVVPPAASPATLILAALPPHLPTISDAGLPALLTRTDPTRSQLIVPDRDGDHRLWIASSPGQAVLLPIDAMLAQRLAAASRLARYLKGERSGPSSIDLTPYQRQRHLSLYRLLDGYRTGARPRELASRLIDPAVAEYSAAEWADCRQRKQVMRWLAQAKAFVTRDYLQLARGEIRRPRAPTRQDAA